MKKYKDQWFNLDFDGLVRRAKCIDIEFQSELGPLFLMETEHSNKFWLTRRELKEHDIYM